MFPFYTPWNQSFSGVFGGIKMKYCPETKDEFSYTISLRTWVELQW